MASPKDNPASEASAMPPAKPVDFDALIEAWWNDHFPGSEVARHTPAWNVAHAAKEDLKKRLKGA